MPYLMSPWNQHHPVRFAETVLRSFSGHRCTSASDGTPKSGFVEITLHRGSAFRTPGATRPLQFQDIDNLTNRTFLGLPASAGLPVPEVHQSFPGASGSVLVPGPEASARGIRPSCKPLHSDYRVREDSPFCSAIVSLSWNPLCVVQRSIQQWRDQLVPLQRLFLLPLLSFRLFSLVINLLCREGTTGQW